MWRAVTRVVSLGRPTEGYELSFRSAMLTRIRPGDCVWDVGANIGLYSELFAAAVGISGKVVSFEPSRACTAMLEERRGDARSNASWQIVPVALSDKDGEAWLSVGGGGTSPGNHLASRDEASTVQVQTARGDSLVTTGYAAPAVLKVDVEGFEGEVLDGMGPVLDNPALHTICVEVHFGILNKRGKPYEPSRIVRLLEAHAFDVKWVDRSHFVARR